AILHPGYVKTDMTGHQGLIEVDESATGLIGLMDALSLETSGGFWHTNGEPLPW
ncbi:MAG TPA: short-chain dehydrogenase, partial [Gammaproteobacteria bacterium]|nr:short-chain dehydrogenase [Gammaproteobacteria bacterium]